MSNMRHDINKINFSRPFKEQHYQRDCQLLLKRKNSKKRLVYSPLTRFVVQT